MKQFNGLLLKLPKSVKWLVGLFIFVMSIGFFAGIRFVDHTTELSTEGIQENFLGNEDDEDANEMKYEKTEVEMFTLLHTHVLSFSLMFFLSGGLVLMTSAPTRLQNFFALEPLLSIIFTFGGIFLMWKGILWMKYIVIISGILMTICYSGSVFLILRDVLKKPPKE